MTANHKVDCLMQTGWLGSGSLGSELCVYQCC